MYDKILALLQEHGPMLPVEVASKTQLNSFLAKAYMEELVQQGKLVQGEKIGSTPIFLLPGQEAQASKRAEELLDTSRTVAAHVGKDVDMSPEAVAKREQFKAHFEKAISTPDSPKVKHIVTPVEAKTEWVKLPDVIEEEKPVEVKRKLTNLFSPKKVEPVQRQEFKPVKVDKPIRVAPIYQSKISSPSGYVSRIRKMFESGNAKLVEEISEKKKQGKFVVDFPSSIGAVRYYVTVYDKRSINKSDIALAYTEASNKKLPALLLTNGKLASGAEEYADELGGMFKWKAVK